MKTILTLAMFFLVSFTEEKTFCEGFEEGYKSGFCKGDEFCIEPISPLCPIPHIGQNEYEDGYLKGVIAGKKKKCDEESI